MQPEDIVNVEEPPAEKAAAAFGMVAEALQLQAWSQAERARAQKLARIHRDPYLCGFEATPGATNPYPADSEEAGLWSAGHTEARFPK